MVGSLCATGLLLAAALTAVVVLATQRVPRWQLAQSTCLLTGGSVGIGLETAKTLAQRNVRHLVIAARRESVLQEATKAIEAARDAVRSKTKVSYVVMDVSDPASVSAGLARARQQCDGKPVDLLICNAGFAIPARFTDCTLGDAKRMMDVNYFGCLNAVWGVLPDMLAAGRGRIVLTSSMVARTPIAGYTLYAATKAGLRAFAHALDMENSCLGVRVQVVSPPDVETPGFEREETIKSPECRAISAFGGATPFKASDMGKAVVDGIERYRFDITLGTDGWILSAGSAGIEPATSALELLVQTLTGGVLRIGLAVFSRIHYGIVHRIRFKERTEKKKAR